MRIVEIEVDDFSDYKVGDKVSFTLCKYPGATLELHKYMVTRVESLSKRLDGIYEGRPARVTLR